MYHRMLKGVLLLLGLAVCVGCEQSTIENPTTGIQSTDALAAGIEGAVAETDLVAVTQPRPSEPTDWFEDVTAASGVSFRHQSGRGAGAFTMIESFGSGVGLLDYDGDGDLDLFCVGGGTITPKLEVTGAPCRLFRNDGDFHFVDVTTEAGLDVPIDYSHGVTVGDVNNDGRPDLFVTSYGRSRLFVNVDGRRFADETEQRHINIDGWHTAACMADVTADGLADLFVTGYLEWSPDPDERCLDPKSGLRDVCMPGLFTGAEDHLLIAQPDGTFIDGSDRAGLLPDGKGLGVVAADFDENGLLDLYVANDVIRNHLYLNQGDGEFVETAIAAGVAGNEFGAAEGSMGVDVGDFNADGRLDITVTNYEFEDNDLYRNEGQGLFSHVTIPVGLGGGCKPYVGFGTLFFDADSDGWHDLLVVNGHVTYRNRQAPYQQPAFLYRNEDGVRFRDVTEQAGPWFSVPHSGRGAAVGDLNNDGAPDLVITEQDGPVSILKNRLTPSGWIGFHLQGSQSGTDAVGARVQLLTPAESALQTIVAGRSYLSSSDPRLLFPLDEDDSAAVEVEVAWPSGLTEVFGDLTPGAYHQLQEGSGLTAAR